MKSLRRQLTLRMIVALALVLGAGLLGVYAAVWVELVRAFDAGLRTRALGLCALIEQEPDGRVQFEIPDTSMPGYGAVKPHNYFEIRDALGSVVARSPSLGENDLAPAPDGSIDGHRAFDLPLPNGRKGRALRIRFRPRSEEAVRPQKAAVLSLTVASDRDDLNETLAGLLASVAGCGVLLAAVVLIVVPRVLRRGLAPLERLGEQAGRIDSDSLTGRFATEGLPAELQPVAARLNDLLARLEASFERERRFSADLAHELRTPVAELRSLTECALKWPESREANTDRDALAIALQMEELIERLLELARSDSGELVAQLSNVDLTAAATGAWHPFVNKAADRGLHMDLNIEPGIVRADPVLLGSILRNLFDNAVSYAPPGDKIEVHGGATGVRVSNGAPDLLAEDAAQLFDRFWRKEEARSGGVHAGLGLSLARAYARAMNWRLETELSDGRLSLVLRTGGK